MAGRTLAPGSLKVHRSRGWTCLPAPVARCQLVCSERSPPVRPARPRGAPRGMALRSAVPSLPPRIRRPALPGSTPRSRPAAGIARSAATMVWHSSSPWYPYVGCYLSVCGYTRQCSSQDLEREEKCTPQRCSKAVMRPRASSGSACRWKPGLHVEGAGSSVMLGHEIGHDWNPQ